MKLAFQLLRTDVCVLVTQSCPTLCNPTNCSPPVFSVHGILGQEYWSGLPFPSLEDLLDPGIKLWSPASQANSLLFELQGSPTKNKYQGLNFYCGKQSIYKVIIATVCIL